MRLEILGSGGAVTTPRPLCACEMCRNARDGDSRHSRYGPSVFLHGPDILVDTPEEISIQLNRSTVDRIEACLYSHWHPDHTSGRRIFEMNRDWVGNPPRNSSTTVIITERVNDTFARSLGLRSYFDFLSASGLVHLRVVGNAESFSMNGFEVTPVQMGHDYSFGFDVQGQGKRVLVIMDELKFWDPPPEVRSAKYDLIYMPIGIVDVNPITAVRNIDPDHPNLEDEQTLQETLGYVRDLHSKKFILSHVEEPDGISFEVGEKLGDYCSRITGKKVEVAYDTQMCEV